VYIWKLKDWVGLTNTSENVGSFPFAPLNIGAVNFAVVGSESQRCSNPLQL
jgi:hypothetical protein